MTSLTFNDFLFIASLTLLGLDVIQLFEAGRLQTLRGGSVLLGILLCFPTFLILRPGELVTLVNNRLTGIVDTSAVTVGTQLSQRLQAQPDYWSLLLVCSAVGTLVGLFLLFRWLRVFGKSSV